MDLFKDNQQADEQATRAVEPLTGAAPAGAKPARRRRTERFAGLIEEIDNPFEDPDFFGTEQQAQQPAAAGCPPPPRRPHIALASTPGTLRTEIFMPPTTSRSMIPT